MIIRKLQECDEFTAGDGSVLREFLHPSKEDLAIRYSLAYATVRPGEVTKLHKLKTAEVYYILEGEGMMHIDDEAEKVGSGYTVYIPPDSTQNIENIGNSDLKFLCIVDPAWRPQDEEVIS